MILGKAAEKEGPKKRRKEVQHGAKIAKSKISQRSKFKSGSLHGLILD
jgi:hypothetical protein